MSAALGFTVASDLGPSPSERDVYEATIRAQAEQLQEAREADPRQSGGMSPQEKQALVQLLSDQSKKIKDLEKALKDVQEDILQIRDYFPKLVSEDRKRISDLEGGPDIQESTTAKAHVDELHKHMEAVGRKQLSFKEASRCLKLSKSRMLQFKVVIALDDRFIIVPSETHKQKKLIRLRKYFQGDEAH